ncbi:MAG: BMP family ABC transporter substrate-binding protein [Acidimicrobiia bacterium]|nr:BMP family ABC transporter substrate-binding protein [Acidimicrobiia bacterium]MYE67937.1 BMP family ABC transporter substrate-binding protein [Acidimicrobiia bacterium]
MRLRTHHYPRHHLLVALMAALALLAASCGSGDEGAAAPAPAPAPATTAAPAPPEAPTTTAGPEPSPTPEPPPAAPTTTVAASQELRIAMISDGEALLGGWYGSMDLGRQHLEDHVDGITVDVVENIAVGQVAQRTIEDLAADGYDIVISIATFDADIAKVAPDYPDTVFLQSCDATVLENMAQYCPATEQARYADGVLAASLSEAGKIGYVYAFETPYVVKPLNAFVLGAQSVNPDIVVEVVGTNSWFDPTLERQAAQSLVNSGADVLTYDLSSSAIPEVAAENGIAFVGFGYDDAATQAPDAWAGGSIYNWGPIWVEQVEAVQAGAWETNYAYGGYESGYLTFSEIPASVPPEVRATVEAAIEGLRSGEIVPLAGPIHDRDGNVVVADGEEADGGWCCDWVVRGVVGDIL